MQNDDPAEALDRAHALPARHYFGDAMLEMEQRAVFARSWQLLARSDQLAEPGDHVVETIGTVPVLLVRGRTGSACVPERKPASCWSALCNGKGANVLHCRPRLDLHARRPVVRAPEMWARAISMSATSARRHCVCTNGPVSLP
jgi:choline monooxygenase